MRIKFLGANRQVTGSRYCLEAAGKRVLIDCGMFQERVYQARNWDPPPENTAGIDAMLLTHAHLDHTGLVPRVVQQGFHGPIYCTEPTVELTQVVVRDSARIQEEDVAYKRKRHKKEGRRSPHPYEPLYTSEDAEKVGSLLRPVGFDEPVRLADGLSVRFLEAGHILGSAMLEITARENGTDRRIVFSGDVGQWDVPIVRDPTLIDGADYVILESTYGDRDHERAQDVEDQLADVITAAMKGGGNVLIPTFAIERAQEMLLHLAEIVHAKRVPRVMTFLDSPMAVNVTEIFARYPDYMDEETREILSGQRLAHAWNWLKLVRSVEESRAINSIRGTCIVLAGSGMCTGGRIKHHLVQNIHRPESIILFVGYQAVHTLGRQILDGNETVRIFGRPFPVRAQVRQIQGLSAHADRSDLLRWLEHFERAPRRLFLTHGEERSSEALAETVREKMGWDVRIPEYREEFELD